MTKRIFLLSPSGWGNQGDNAILRGLADEIIEMEPDVSLILATLNPIESARGVGYPAVPLRGAQIADHWVRTFEVARPVESPRAETSESRGRDKSRSRPVRRLFPGPVRRVVSWVARPPRRIMQEIRFYLRVLSWLRNARGVIVAGGGQLDAEWGGALGQPFTLALWALAARVRRVPFMMLSVGAGSLESSSARHFVRTALNRSAHLSVRDERTRDLVSRISGRQADSAPDLAFLLTATDPSPRRHRPPGSDRIPSDAIGVLGMSPMAYGRPGSWPVGKPAVHDRIRQAMVEAGITWLRQGGELLLFTTCSMDDVTAEEVKDLILEEAPEQGDRVRTRFPDTPEGVLSVLSEVDLVVAARLHGVVLSQVAGRPVIAISHHWKVSEQMSMVGHEDLTFDPTTVTASDLTQAMERLRVHRSTVEETLRRFATESRTAVQADVRKGMALLRGEAVNGWTPSSRRATGPHASLA